MAQINEAWWVLSDPARRAAYDAAHRAKNSAQQPGQRARPHPANDRTQHLDPIRHASLDDAIPARFPWRFMLAIAGVGIAFVLVNAALTEPGVVPAPDNLMEVGSCVDIMDNGDAREVLCNGPNDGVVADLRPASTICPLGTELHRDRQGMGNICVQLTDG